MWAPGIGTGWSSTIPNYNPQDLIDNLRRMLKGEVRGGFGWDHEARAMAL